MGSLEQTALLTEPSSEWTNKVIDNIIAGRSLQAVKRFKRQPVANKLIALQNAVVPPRVNDTPSKIVTLLEELIRMGAISKSEAAPLYSDLLIRVHRYNSSNVQSNLDILLGDIRTAQSEAIRNSNIGFLSNQSILNSFFQSLPSVVPLGQQNFEALKQTLRLFVNEAPNVTLFKSGPDTMMQVNIRGVNTVNLNQAFNNLNRFWGITVYGDSLPNAVTSQLSSNTRVLLLLLAPFTNANTFSPDTVLNVLVQLYRDTISASLEEPQQTEREIERIAMDVGTSGLDLTRTMGYLLKNRENSVVTDKVLSPRQLQLLRFIQQSLFDRIDRNGEDPAQALAEIPLSFAPSFYEENGSFIRRLIHYLELALRNSPSYFREIYSNKYWTPPSSFWTRNYNDFFLEIQNPRSVFEMDVAGAPVNSNPLSVNDSFEWDLTGSDRYNFATPVAPSVATRVSTERFPPPPSDSGVVDIFLPYVSNRNVTNSLRRQDSINSAEDRETIHRLAQRIRETILPSRENSIPSNTSVAGDSRPTRPNRFQHLEPK